MAPRGSFASAHNRPPWLAMMDRQIDSPMPIPLGLVAEQRLSPRLDHQAEQIAGLCVIVVAFAVIVAVGIAQYMQWRLLEARVLDRPPKPLGS